MASEFSKNLKYLCAEKHSTAEVCRDLGINQQQFSKYLSGKSKPSPYNLRKISRYFGIDEAIITGPFEPMFKAYNIRSEVHPRTLDDPFSKSFPGDLKKLRPYLGAYQVFFNAPIIPGGVVANAIFLDERNGQVHSRLVEALPESNSRHRRWTRCDGKVSYQSDRIYVVDRERRNENALSMQILSQPPRQRRRYLYGTMCFLASLPRRIPYASRVVWRQFETYKSVRELLETCGVYSLNNKTLDPKVRNFLQPPTIDPR